ncbi:MAG: hypothetical protein MUP55_02920 [Candidatus Aenigmarchaeota archaeon]|nr:hypothetical protein [Candidatus Aenigmarchaeota archaeon]
MAREFLPKNQSVVLVGEYRYPKFEDLKNFGGGMTQAFSAQLLLDRTNVTTRRIVEQRGIHVENWTVPGIYDKYNEWVFYFAVKQVLSFLGKVWAIVDMGESGMYMLLESDWSNWENIMGVVPFPDHLDFIDETLPDKIDSVGVVGYFGVGKNGWTIPKKDRSYVDLIAGPYDGGIEIESLAFSGFVYDDHDMSANSSIKESVIRNGGGILTSSGVIHDPYTMHTSNLFFSGMTSGKPLGQALIDSVNMEPLQTVVGFMFLNQIYSQFGQQPGILAYPFLYSKDKFERILFADPAIIPIKRKMIIPKFYSLANPSHSFMSESRIESDYTIENNSLDFWNADDYIFEKEKPITPVFVREFILPENAILNWVNVSGSYSMKNVSPVIVYNDSYYSDYIGILGGCINSSGIENEQELEAREEEVFSCMDNSLRPNVSYPYPNSTFWWRENKLLDNRTLVYVFVPAALYENESSALVLENATVQIDYEAGVEMNVFAQDVYLGQNETVSVEMMNLWEESSGTLWIFVEGNGSLEFSENITIPASSNLTKEFPFSTGMGDYEVIAVFDSNNSVGPRYAYFSVHDMPPAIAVPEVNESEQVFAIEPAHYSEKTFSVNNSGNAPLELEISCEGFSGILCEPDPQTLNLLSGEQSNFSVNISVPGGHSAGEYSGKIVLTGNEFSVPRTKEIPLKVNVLEAAYWSVFPPEWVCNLPDCTKNFSVTNSPDSNALLHADISLEGLNLVSVQNEVSVEPGQEKNVTASAKITKEGLLSGVYAGNITFESGGYSEPSGLKINVTLIAGGPVFSLEKEFQPDKIRLFWKQFVVPKINHVEIYMNNTGDNPIEKINLSDEIPDGWKGKKPVLAFVKRNKKAPVKEFSFSSGNGYANFSFDFSKNPLAKGEGLEIHYMIFSQPEFVPAGDIITRVSAEAGNHENIYSRISSSATLNVEYFDPPAWLRWLFILIYRLW